MAACLGTAGIASRDYNYRREKMESPVRPHIGPLAFDFDTSLAKVKCSVELVQMQRKG
jgi:hypothetical protein